MNFPICLTENSHKLVLNHIRQKRQLSGAELSRITGLQPSTMVYILRTLSGAGLIEKDGFGESTQRGGKKPRLWRIQTNSLYIAGLEVLPNQFRMLITAINGDILLEKIEVRNRNNLSDGLINDIIRFFNDSVTLIKLKTANILGLGIAFPGLVDMETGKIIYSKSLQLEDFSITGALEKALALPVYISNDAHAGALAVQWYTDVYDSFPGKVFLMYNPEATNLGSGIILNNTLYSGSNGMAGEIFSPLPKVCELYEEGKTKIPANKTKYHPNHTNDCELSDIIRFEKEGCMLSKYILEKICEHIAVEITHITGFLNPDLFILGGDLPEGAYCINKYIMTEVRQQMEEKLNMGYVIPDIVSSPYQQFSVAMGANAIVLSAWLTIN